MYVGIVSIVDRAYDVYVKPKLASPELERLFAFDFGMHLADHIEDHGIDILRRGDCARVVA